MHKLFQCILLIHIIECFVKYFDLQSREKEVESLVLSERIIKPHQGPEVRQFTHVVQHGVIISVSLPREWTLAAKEGFGQN